MADETQTGKRVSNTAQPYPQRHRINRTMAAMVTESEDHVKDVMCITSEINIFSF